MRFLRLDLRAYGPFTDAAMDLSDGRFGLHVIEGPNEAGKSTALRAIRALLFGIPVRTNDGFVHDYRKLRVGATLEDERGGTLAFLRRKANSKTLRCDDDSTELPDDALVPFLGSMTEDRFLGEFALDREAHAQGGQAALAAGGRLGELLFGAGVDLGGAMRFRRALTERIDALFLPRAQRPTINLTLAKLGEAGEAVKAASLMSAEWQTRDDMLRVTTQEIAQLDADTARGQREKSRLERIRRVAPELTRLRAILTAMEEEIPLLREDFAADRLRIERELDRARRSVVAAGDEIQAIEAKSAGQEPDEAILRRAEDIEALKEAYGSHKKARLDAPKISAELAEAEGVLREHKRDLALADGDEPPAITVPVESRLMQLRNGRLELTAERDAARADLERAQRTLREAEAVLEELSGLADPSALARAVDRAKRLGDLKAEAARARAAASKARREAEADARKQTRLPFEPVRWNGMTPPQTERLESFRDERNRARKRLDDLDEKVALAGDVIERLRREREELRAGGDVPTREDLRKARERRDGLWSTTLTELDAGAGIDRERTRQLTEAIAAADVVADRLLAEADRVEQLRQVESRLEAAQEDRTREIDKRDAVRKEAERIDAEWRALWATTGLEPDIPEVMIGWVRIHEKVVAKLSEATTSDEQAAGVARVIADCCAELRREVEVIGHGISARNGDLADHISSCDELIESIRADLDRRRTAERDLKRATDEIAAAHEALAEAELALEKWQAAWDKAVAPLGLEPGTDVEIAELTVKRLHRLREASEKVASLWRRLTGIERDRTVFVERVREIATEAAPDVAALDVDRAVDELRRRLATAVDLRARREARLADRERQERNLRAARRAVASAEEVLAALCREAGCTDPGSLAVSEERSAERRRLLAERADVERRLYEQGDGLTIDQLRSEAADVDNDGLTVAIDRLDAELASRREDYTRARETAAELRNELARMDESARQAVAVEKAGEREDILVRLSGQIECYARYKIAAAVLDRSIERYREKNQGPLIGRASEYFRRLTCGSFEGLRPDRTENGDPCIYGLRGGELLSVEAMSEGTVDQLYLALKLASVEHHLDHGPPMPFIIDDILVHFDDARASAALGALAELSRRTQVLFFTHHTHLVELARLSVPPDELFVHRLDSRRPVPQAS